MKPTKLLLSALLALLLLPSCEKLDWREVDYEANVTLKQLDLPFATIRVKIGDLLGLVDNTMLTTDPETGVLLLQKEFDIPANAVQSPFEKMDLSGGGSNRFYLLHSNASLQERYNFFLQRWNDAKTLYNMFPDAQETQDAMQAFETLFGYPFNPNDSSVHFSGAYLQQFNLQDLKFEFPLTMELDSLAEDNHIRLDSALFNAIALKSLVNLSEGMDLPWTMVDSIVITLGEQFSRQGGNRMYLYNKSTSNPAEFGWGKQFNFSINDFSLCLMKDRNPAPGTDLSNNNVNSISMNMQVGIHVNSTDIIALGNTDPYVDYDMQINMNGISAVWGMLDSQEFSKFNVNQTIDLSEVWQTLDNIGGNISLPFDDPRINFDLTTKGIAGHMLLRFTDLYTTDKDGNKHAATPKDKHIDIDLGTSTLGASVPTHLALNNTEEGGRIDKLFEGGQPRGLTFGVGLNIDPEQIQMIRVEKDIDISGHGSMRLPFSFNKGMELSMKDTVKGLDLSAISTDSIRSMTGEMVNLNRGIVKILIDGSNGIPEDLILKLTAEDNNNLAVWQDSVFFPAAQSAQPSLKSDSLQISKGDLDLIQHVDHLLYDVRLANAENTSAIKPDQELKLKISLSVADVNADINLNPSK